MVGSPVSEALLFVALADADKSSAAIADKLFLEVATYSVANIQQTYAADPSSLGLASWKECLLCNLIKPIQQLDDIKGQNATDSATIVGVMPPY